MSGPRQSSLAIETPEGVVFSYELATPVARGLAWAVDAAAISAACSAVGTVVQASNLLNPDMAKALGVALYFAIGIAYPMILEWRWRGQTVGKRLLGLRVIDAQGLRLQFPQIAIRNLMRFIDMVPIFYLVGGIAALVSRNAQRLGDLAANTVVARERSVREPDLEQIAPAKYNSLLAHPHLAARLRTRVSPEVAGVAVRAVMLRDAYDPAARIVLFNELAGYFRSLVQFPEASVEGLTDEQYVRSALRVVYAGR